MDTIKQGSRRERVVILLQALLAAAGLPVTIDGRFGIGTDRAVRCFQQQHGLVVDGTVAEKTWLTLIGVSPALVERITSRYLGEDDIQNMAAELGVSVAAVKAVNEVESQGAGFIVDQPKILFEGHVFFERLKSHGLDPNEHLENNGDILNPHWTKKYYLGGLREYERLDKAASIHRAAALESASWGIFQVMGYHAPAIGWPDIEAFVSDMYTHERQHLRAFAGYVRANDLVESLKSQNWEKFARGYNGPGYDQNRYHLKLAQAFARYESGASRLA